MSKQLTEEELKAMADLAQRVLLSVNVTEGECTMARHVLSLVSEIERQREELKSAASRCDFAEKP